MGRTAKRKRVTKATASTELILAKLRGRELQRTQRAQANVVRLARQVERAALRADQALFDLGRFIGVLVGNEERPAAASARIEP
jgi:hypothetical protein